MYLHLFLVKPLLFLYQARRDTGSTTLGPSMSSYRGPSYLFALIFYFAIKDMLWFICNELDFEQWALNL